MDVMLKRRTWILALLLLTAPVQAAMRCDRSWVDVGATVYEVLSKCGDPTFQQLIREPVMGISNGHVHTAQVSGEIETVETESDFWSAEQQYELIERWTYNPGSGRLLQELDFQNGAVIRMRTGSRTP